MQCGDNPVQDFFVFDDMVLVTGTYIGWRTGTKTFATMSYFNTIP